jgi:hypothetical protein
MEEAHGCANHATRAHGYALPHHPTCSHALPYHNVARAHGIRQGTVSPKATCSRPLATARPSSRMRCGRPLGTTWLDLRHSSWPARGRRVAILQGVARLSTGPEGHAAGLQVRCG